jgi:nicotinate phosphoribosyltransferase
MAHSWVQSFADELSAFATFARVFGDASTLLVDTYDTLQGVRHAAAIEPSIPAIRIDSGDLDDLSRRARAILDERGRRETKIMVSGDLDEHRIAALIEAGAPVDGFGVGTELITSRDAPAMSMVYKLVELEGQGRYKLSPGKKTYPMAKQVFRRRDATGRFAGDLVTRADESAEGEPLLVPIVLEGKLVRPWPSLEEVRTRCRDQLAALPPHLLRLDAQPDYPVAYSDALEAAAQQLMTRADRPQI